MFVFAIDKCRIGRTAHTIGSIMQGYSDLKGIVGAHLPSTTYASYAPGQGGIVTPTAAKASGPKDRNWKCVPSGIVIQTPGRS